MKVKVIKISETEVPKFKSGNWDDYKLGKENLNVSLPIDYEIEGELIGEIMIDNSLKVARTKRNGVESFGMFMSSLIDKVSQDGDTTIVETQNSIYLINEI